MRLIVISLLRKARRHSLVIALFTTHIALSSAIYRDLGRLDQFVESLSGSFLENRKLCFRYV